MYIYNVGIILDGRKANVTLVAGEWNESEISARINLLFNENVWHFDKHKNKTAIPFNGENTFAITYQD